MRLRVRLKLAKSIAENTPIEKLPRDQRAAPMMQAACIGAILSAMDEQEKKIRQHAREMVAPTPIHLEIAEALENIA